MLIPKDLEFLIISSIKLVQKIGLNLILIKPGLAIDISSINSSFFLIAVAIVSAKSVGDVWFAFDKNR